MRFSSFGGVLVCAAVCFFAAMPAHGQLIFSLTPSSINTTPGSLITYQGTITNQSLTQGYYINSFAFEIDNVNVQSIEDVDTASFFGYFTGTFPTRQLAANSSYTGNIVNVSIRSDAVGPDTDTGRFILEGGTTTTDFLALASVDFSASIPSSLPETGSLPLLLGGGALGGLMWTRTQRRRTA